MDNPEEVAPAPAAPPPVQQQATTSDEMQRALNELDKIRALVVEHAQSMGDLVDSMGRKVDGIEPRVHALETTSSAQFAGEVLQRLSKLEARVGDALVRLGVETSSQAEALAHKPPPADLVWDGCNFVPKPPTEPSS